MIASKLVNILFQKFCFILKASSVIIVGKISITGDDIFSVKRNALKQNVH